MLHLHSILRWAVLLLLVFSIYRAITGLINKKEFTDGDRKTGLYLMMFAHIQLVLGLILYYTNGWLEVPFKDAMGNSEARFWKVEHIFVMIIAIGLITVGRIQTKKIEDSVKGHKKALIYYGIALLLILSRIPWDATKLY